MRRLISLMLIVLLMPKLALAVLNLELTKGIKTQVPIAVVPFAWHGSADNPPVKVGQIIQNDLLHSGQFKTPRQVDFSKAPTKISQVNFAYWRQYDLSALVIGQLQDQGNEQYQLSVSLVNLFKNKKQIVPQSASGAEFNPQNNPLIFQKTLTVNQSNLRRVAHQVADQIYQELLGSQGYFTSQIAYISVPDQSVPPEKYKLMVADYDGYDPKPVLISSHPVAAPAWSPDGKQLAYVSYENNDTPAIYTVNLKTQDRKLIADFDDPIEGSPAWSPDGKQLAFIMVKNGTPQLFRINLATGKLNQITHGWFTNAEPVWAPDGHTLFFTSNRSGSPQIYKINLITNNIVRLTHQGSYNAAPTISPQGNKLAFLKGNSQGYNLALLNLKNKKVKVLTHNSLVNSPSFSPNGNLLLYSVYHKGQTQLAVRSLDGRVQFMLPAKQGFDQKEPVWGPA